MGHRSSTGISPPVPLRKSMPSPDRRQHPLRRPVMKRREFVSLVGGASAWPLAARAQQRGVPVIGLLHPQSPDAYRDQLVPFYRALKEAGYVEGQTVALEYRW